MLHVTLPILSRMGRRAPEKNFHFVNLIVLFRSSLLPREESYVAGMHVEEDLTLTPCQKLVLRHRRTAVTILLLTLTGPQPLDAP